MNFSWQYRFIFTALVIIISKSNVSTRGKSETVGEDPSELSPDFFDFVKGLDSMVFNRDGAKRTTASPIKRNTLQKKQKNLKFRKNSLLRSSQNSALRDILMMKLVSYYEDKYKVAKHERSTSVSTSTPEPSVNTSPGPIVHAIDGQAVPGILNQNSIDSYVNVNSFDQNALDQTGAGGDQEITHGLAEVVAL